MSSNFTLKKLAIFNANKAEGLNFPVSIEWIVNLVTPTAFAKSCCEISLCSKRYLRK